MKDDTLYCNVDKDKILNSNPKINDVNLSHLYNWITERYNIHLKKDVQKISPPWTNDEVLSNFRFTNVKRYHDKETIWLIDNVCNNDELNIFDKLLNCIIFRIYNKHESCETIGMPLIFDDNINFDDMIVFVDEKLKEEPKYKFFTNAFFTSGTKRGLKTVVSDDKSYNTPLTMNSSHLPVRFIEYLYKNGEEILLKIIDADTQKDTFDLLNSLGGIGPFLAYQIFVDLTYITEFKFTDKEFTVAGPGCRKGLKYIFDDFDGLNWDEAVFWLKDNQDKLFKKFGYNPKKLFSDIPEEERSLDVMSLENCMCEISKYIRAINGEGRPRNRYKVPFVRDLSNLKKLMF